MVINVIYILIFSIFSFLSYLIIKSLVRGVNEKNKKKILEKKIIKQCWLFYRYNVASLLLYQQ